MLRYLPTHIENVEIHHISYLNSLLQSNSYVSEQDEVVNHPSFLNELSILSLFRTLLFLTAPRLASFAQTHV